MATALALTAGAISEGNTSGRAKTKQKSKPLTHSFFGMPACMGIQFVLLGKNVGDLLSKAFSSSFLDWA
jgi:hypothetical protein